MAPVSPKRRVVDRSGAGIRQRERTYRLSFESLEDRTMLDAGIGSLFPPAIVVGRTLSSYFVGGVQNNQETITYTVYNEQADPETGVLADDDARARRDVRRAPRSCPTRAARTWPGAWGRSTGSTAPASR